MFEASRLLVGRRLTAWCVVGGLAAAALCAGRATADTRKFVVMLALSAKSGDSGAEDYPVAPGQPPAPFGEVDLAYFDRSDPNGVNQTLSFREYWEEISYGDVTVDGRTFDFVDLPWRQYPAGAALPAEGEDVALKLVWIDLDQDPTVRTFSYGIGESFDETQQMYQQISLRLPETAEWGVFAVTGLQDGVWTPGERFRDLNGSGNYTYVECPDPINFSCAESENAFDADDNGQIDCPVCGAQFGGVFDEPFEDYLRVYDPTAPEGARWVILFFEPCTDCDADPATWPDSWGGFRLEWYPVDPRFLAQLAPYTHIEYIAQNYPGAVGAYGTGGTLLGRIGDGRYQSPDKWTERNTADNRSIKVLRTGFDEPGYSTAAPGWLATFWSARYGTATPTWSSNIPRLEYFNPEEPDPSSVPNTDQAREFIATDAIRPGGGGTGIYPIDPDPGTGSSNVLPDQRNEYYDGAVEFDDLASSIHHVYQGGAARWSNGDLRLGEVTSPVGFNTWGDTADGFEGPITAAGPLASRIFGERGNDAGNLLNLELLTWRNLPDGGASATRPFASNDPGKAIWNSNLPVTPGGPMTYRQMYAGGFRDFNLDGLIDQGETLPFDTATDQYSNYVVSVNDTIELNGFYPFNRTRLVEDVVEALDATVNFRQHTDPNDPTYPGHIYGTVLMAPQGEDPFDAVGREFSPSLVPIQTEDGTFSFTNLVGSLANVDPETGALRDPPIKPNYDIVTTAHEYGHFWEGWPDLYDEIGLDPGDIVINNPIGRWDLMAVGSMVHPSPYLKQNVNIGTGAFHGGIRQHTPWVSPVDLRTVLTPGQAQTVILPPCEFRRSGTPTNYPFYYFDNVATPARRERFYFWVVADQGFSRSIDPNDFQDVRIPHTGLPGFGLLIGQIDLGDDQPGTAFPAQNPDSTGSFWVYNQLQADGLQELETNVELDGIGPGSCTRNEEIIGEPNSGDAGDPFPGCSNRTRWNKNTQPPSMWHDELESGLEILNVQAAPPSGRGRAVTFLWDPREVPSLSFIQPPGGESVACGPPVCTRQCEVYRVRYRAFDFFGGTQIEFYIDDDPNDGRYDGTLLSFDLNRDVPGACGLSPTTRVPKRPGSVINNVPIDVSELEDGDYFFYARMVPGGSEVAVSDVYPAAGNTGNGTLTVTNVDLNTSRVEVWTVFVLAGGQWQVTGTASGNQSGRATTGVPYTTDNGQVSFTINAGTVAFVPGDRFTFFTTGLTAYSQRLKVQNGMVLAEPVAIFEASPATGSVPPPLDVTFTSTSLDPQDRPLTHDWDFGDGTTPLSGLELRVVEHAYADAGDYTVTLTVSNDLGGEDAATAVVRVIANDPPVAVITEPNDPFIGVAPVSVHFNGTASSDPEGTPLLLKWDFGDGSNPVVGDMAQVGEIDHLYQAPGEWTATLTVTDNAGEGESDSASVTIQLTPNTAPVAAFTTDPDPPTGCPALTVAFDASASSDLDDDPLTFTWDFGDGSPPASGTIVEHTYQAVGDYTVILTVSDGDLSSQATALVQVARSSEPVAALETEPDPPVGRPPLTVTFDARASSDPEGSPLTFAWDFGDGATASGQAVVTHTYGLVGEVREYTATVTVTDECGESGSTTVLVSLTGNTAPTAVFTANPTSGVAPLTVNFDARASSDPDGEIVSYQWDFGDGSVGTGPQVSNTYEAIGRYTVMLTVSDDEGATGQATRAIEVASQAPVIALEVTPTSGSPPLEVRFDARGSRDPEGGALSFSWVFGDGGTAGNQAEVTHTYESVGVFTARLTATDEEGATSTEFRSITVTVPGNRAPAVSLVADKTGGDAPLTVNFDLSGTSDPDGDSVVLTLDFGDGNVLVNLLPTSMVSHTYTEPATYTAIAVGSDGSGASAQATVVITVTGVAPPPTPPSGGFFPCAFGMVEMIAGSLVGLLLMSVGTGRWRRLEAHG